MINIKVSKNKFYSTLLLCLFLLPLAFASLGCEPVKNEENIIKAKEIFSLEEFPNMDFTSGLLPVYLVSTAEEFNNIRKYKDRMFLIVNDIDMSSIENFEPIGTKDDPFIGEISSGCIYTFGKKTSFSSPVCNNDGIKTISNINIKITDDNYHEYVGVLGYTSERNIDYYHVGYEEIVGKKSDRSHDFNREKVHDLIFNNINIEINTTKPTIVGGIAGRMDSNSRTFILNSHVTGNYIVGGAYGIHDDIYNDSINWSFYSMFNQIEITPVKNESYIGGYIGKGYDKSLSSEIAINYNKIKVNESAYSSSTYVGGIFGSLYTNHRYCTHIDFNGYSFEEIDQGSGKFGLIIGLLTQTQSDVVNNNCQKYEEVYNPFQNSQFYSYEKHKDIPLYYELTIDLDKPTTLIYPLTKEFGDEDFDYQILFESYKNKPILHYIDGYEYPIIEYSGYELDGIIEKLIDLLNQSRK